MSEEVRSDVIFQLGQQRLVDLEYFKTLFKKTANRELRDKITFAVGQSATPEGTAWLLDLARDKTVDTETRKNAIFQVSQRKALALEGLSALYDQSKGDSEIQEQILFAFSQRREPAALDKLMAVAKSDPD